jgi:hypothetical protein
MNIEIKPTTEVVEAVKRMASKNKAEALEAQAALAVFIGPLLAEVINQAPTLSNLFSRFPFTADDNPSIPLDLYYDISDEDYIQVYSQQVAGGLPQNQVVPTASELKMATYTLNTDVSFDMKYARQSRLDVIAKSFTRMAQEVLLKQETISANLVLGALAAASTNGVQHVQLAGATGNTFVLDDLNTMLTQADRIWTAWNGGTPDQEFNSVTDLLVSPEIIEKIRAMAYNPINTSTGPVGGAGSDGQMASDSVRNQVFTAGGVGSFYGINFLKFREMGVGRKWNTVFDTLSTETYSSPDGGISSTFAGATDEILVGINRNRESLIRAVASDSDFGGEFSVTPDDQYSIRQQKIGWFGGLEEGRVILDQRALVGKVVHQ